MKKPSRMNAPSGQRVEALPKSDLARAHGGTGVVPEKPGPIALATSTPGKQGGHMTVIEE